MTLHFLEDEVGGRLDVSLELDEETAECTGLGRVIQASAEQSKS